MSTRKKKKKPGPKEEAPAAPEAPLTITVQPVKKVRIATTWLDGCSGCHMSFLDIDERIVELQPELEARHKKNMINSFVATVVEAPRE